MCMKASRNDVLILTRTCTVSSSCCCGGDGSGAYGNVAAFASACTAAAEPAAGGSPPCSAADSAEMRSSCASDSSEPKGLGLGSAAAGFRAAGFSAGPACCCRHTRSCSAAAAWGTGSGTRCRGGLAGLASKGQLPTPSSDDRFRCRGSCRCSVKCGRSPLRGGGWHAFKHTLWAFPSPNEAAADVLQHATAVAVSSDTELIGAHASAA